MMLKTFQAPESCLDGLKTIIEIPKRADQNLGRYLGALLRHCAFAHVFVLLELCNRFTGLVLIYFKNTSVTIRH